MPRHIKTTIIHKLGGYTKLELEQHDCHKGLEETEDNKVYNKGYNDGRVYLIEKLYNTIGSYDGLSKQEWIDKVWYIISHAYFTSRSKPTIEQ